MKPVYTIFIICMMLCFASCSTTSKLTIYGQPGTEILTPSKESLATIDNTGKVVIVNPDDDYYAFLLSRKSGTKEFIPFAWDYTKKTYYGAWVAEGVGIALAGAGCIALLSGSIALLSGAQDVGIPMLGVGGALDLAGIGIGMPANFVTDQTTHQYRYEFISKQETNQDIQFTLPKFELDKSELPEKKDVKVATASISNKSLSSSSSTKSLKDNATKIEGTYVGKGTLKQGNDIIESYNKISVSIKKKSKDTVLVNVIESDGSKYFTADCEYSIKKQSNGKYILTLDGINNATIEIDNNKNLVYVHPRVNIDGDIYKLSITAKK